MPQKKILYLLRQSPYSGSRAVEAIESALVAGVFDQDVSVLFKDDGVYQLLSGQDGARLGNRTVSNVAAALPEYGVERLYVCEDSLAQRLLTAADLVLPVAVASKTQQTQLINSHDVVLND